jgi:hypothetical protein
MDSLKNFKPPQNDKSVDKSLILGAGGLDTSG